MSPKDLAQGPACESEPTLPEKLKALPNKLKDSRAQIEVGMKTRPKSQSHRAVRNFQRGLYAIQERAELQVEEAEETVAEGKRYQAKEGIADGVVAKLVVEVEKAILSLPSTLSTPDMNFPNRNCIHGNRLHRTASLRHSQSTRSQSTQSQQDSNMARFGLFDNFDSSPAPTPVIDDSEFTLNSIRSTPCPAGRQQAQDPASATPRGRALSDEDDNDAQEPIILVPDSTANAAGQAQANLKNRLRDSAAVLREKLKDSTALINNLRTRNDIFEAENVAKEKQLKEAIESAESVRAKADSEAEVGETFRRFVLAVLFLVVLVVIIYSYWCWYNGPEMQYVLRRRREVLGI